MALGHSKCHVSDCIMLHNVPPVTVVLECMWHHLANMLDVMIRSLLVLAECTKEIKQIGKRLVSFTYNIRVFAILTNGYNHFPN